MVGSRLVGGVDKCQSKHSLFLQVRLMDTSERTSDGQSTKFQSSVFVRRTFTVIVVTYDEPLDTLVTVTRCSLRDSSPFDLILDLRSQRYGSLDANAILRIWKVSSLGAQWPCHSGRSL